MGNGVLHSKHQKRAKPTPPSSSILRLEGEKPTGRGVLSHPLHVHPVIQSFDHPQVLQEPVEQQWRKGESFLTSCLVPLNYTPVLCFSQVLPAPSPPTLVNCLGSQLRQRRPASSGPSSLLPQQTRREPVWGPPLAGGERDHSAAVLPTTTLEPHASSERSCPRLPVQPGEKGQQRAAHAHLTPQKSQAAPLLLGASSRSLSPRATSRS